MSIKGTNKKDDSEMRKKKKKPNDTTTSESFFTKLLNKITSLFKKDMPITQNNMSKIKIKNDTLKKDDVHILQNISKNNNTIKTTTDNDVNFNESLKYNLNNNSLNKNANKNNISDASTINTADNKNNTNIIDENDEDENDEDESNNINPYENNIKNDEKSSKFGDKFLKKDGIKGPKDLKQIAEEAKKKSDEMKDKSFMEGDAALQDLKKAESGYNQVVKKKTKKALQGKIFLIRGKDNNRPAWHYILVPPEHIKQLRQQRAGSNIDVTDYGKIVRSGWGENPSDQIVKEIEEEYGD